MSVSSLPNPRRKPVVLMSMGAQERGGQPYQVMTVKYMRPLVEHAHCLPVLAPTCFGADDIEHYLSLADGLYLSGASTNVDPVHYGQDNQTPDKPQDKDRDFFDLPLITAAMEKGLPLLNICRGMQEWNIALGGDLHQKVYALPGMNDHREKPDATLEEEYGPSHSVRLVPGTWYAQLMQADEIPVNSLHGQGLNRLGKGLEALAHAEDGLVEAIHLPTYPTFNIGVQWHPEWQTAQNPHSVRLFEAFGQACQEYAAKRGR